MIDGSMTPAAAVETIQTEAQAFVDDYWSKVG